MVALTTTYLGLPLRSPIVPSASPLSREVETLQRMADAGAGAITLYSLFEEQIEHESQLLGSVLDQTQFIYAESLDFFPMLTEFRRDEREYLKLLEAAKSAVDIPIIASLNGYSAGSWTRYARLFQEAGADAVELNIYYLPTHPRVTSAMVEDMVVEVLREVKAQVQIPVAVKLSPYFSAMAYMAKRLEEAGADGLVLFNRFYQPDLDLENLDVVPSLELSGPSTLRLRVRWLAILFSHVKVPMVASGGVHSSEDALKAVMAGATAVQMTSALLKHGPGALTTVRDGMAQWLQDHEYDSLAQARGSLSLMRCPSPGAFERANYMRVLQGWKP